MNRSVVVSVITLFLLSLSLLLFWKSVWVVSVLLIFIGYVRHQLDPIRNEALWCIGIGIGGGIVEILLVNMGQAWSYTDPHVWGIPIYMPIYWGAVSAAIVSLYEGLMKHR